jgi:hypothetical protein
MRAKSSAETPPPGSIPSSPPTAQVNALRAKMSEEAKSPGSTAATATGAPKSDGGPKVEGPKVEGEKAAAAAGKLTADELVKIKELPETEQQAAIAQLSCPVSGEPLGSMGKPYKVSALGRSFYLCCKSCEKDVNADPKSVLAKLDQKRP